MDIMELGAIGELVGGVAVVVTLLYLAAQVRQSNEIAKDNSAKMYNETRFAIAGAVATDRQLAELVVQGGEGFDQLDEVDQERLVFFEWRGLDAWHLAWHHRSRGIMTDSQWNKAMWNMKRIGQRQSMQRAWALFRESYDEEFQQLLDPYLGHGVR